MTFATEKEIPQSWKIVLVELDLPLDTEFLINYESGIWFREMTELIPRTGTFTLFGSYANDNTDDLIYQIESARVGNIPYTNVDSLADVRTTNKSFFYDVSTANIYFHFDNFDRPGIHGTITIGVVTGYADTAESSGRSYYNDIYYEPRIQAIPKLSKAKDPTFFGKLKFAGGSIKLDNRDGFFDDFKNLDIYGQQVRVKIGFDGLAYSQFNQVFQGFVDSISWNRNSFTMGVNDLRKNLETPIPTNLYTVADYADLQEDDIGKPIPIAYGQVRQGKATFVVETVANTKFQFKFMDTEFYSVTSIGQIYVEEVEVAEDSSDLSDATFILDVAIWDGEGEVTVDFTGATVGSNTGFDILEDILDKYADLPFIDDIFNTTEWTSESANSRVQGVYIGERQRTFDVIEFISVSDDAFFFIQDNGLITARIFDSERASAKTLESFDWVDEPKFSQPPSEFLSSVRIKYNKNQKTNNWKSITDVSSESEAFDRYKKKKERDIDTALINSADATAKAGVIMDRSKKVEDTVVRKTYNQHVDLEIMDFIKADHAREGQTGSWGIYEIIGINKDMLKAQISLTMKLIHDLPFIVDNDENFIVDANKSFLVARR